MTRTRRNRKLANKRGARAWGWGAMSTETGRGPRVHARWGAGAKTRTWKGGRPTEQAPVPSRPDEQPTGPVESHEVGPAHAESRAPPWGHRADAAAMREAGSVPGEEERPRKHRGPGQDRAGSREGSVKAAGAGRWPREGRPRGAALASAGHAPPEAPGLRSPPAATRGTPLSTCTPPQGHEHS